jgi:hypothetical protein
MGRGDAVRVAAPEGFHAESGKYSRLCHTTFMIRFYHRESRCESRRGLLTVTRNEEKFLRVGDRVLVARGVVLQPATVIEPLPNYPRDGVRIIYDDGRDEVITLDDLDRVSRG